MTGLSNEKLETRGTDAAVFNNPVSDIDGSRGGDVVRSARNVVNDIRKQTENARSLLANMSDILGDDAELITTTVEGETNLNDAIERAVNRVFEIDGILAGIAEMAKSLSARKERLGNQRDLLRTLIASGLDVAGVKRLELASATVSLKAVPPSVQIIDESAIPTRFMKPQPPKLDRKAIMDALKDKQSVPGATLSNGSMTIQIKGA